MQSSDSRVFDSAYQSVYLSTALNALVSQTLPPDRCVTGFHEADLEVPFITRDDVVDEPDTGLLLWAAAARKAGLDRFRTVLIHPSLRFTIPKTQVAVRRVLAHTPSVVVAEKAGVSVAVLILGVEGDVSVYACEPVRYRPIGAGSAMEAVRHLRHVVMEGLALVERVPEVTDQFRNMPWRDWQADFTQMDLPSGFFHSEVLGNAMTAAIRVHADMSPVLAPGTVQPTELGQVLAALHQAAGDVVTTATRDSAI